MAFGNSFASFVDGFVSGRDVKNRWEDRRDQKERQKVLDGYEAQRQERLAETHDWNRDRQEWAGETHGWNRDRHGVFMDREHDADRLRDLSWQDTLGIREATTAADEAAAAGMAGPVETAATSGGMGAAPDPQQLQGPKRPPADAAFLRPVEGGKVVASRPPRNNEEKRALVEAAQAGTLIQSDEASDRQDQIDAAGNARMQEGAIARNLRIDDDKEWGLPGQAGADIRDAAKVVGRGAVTVADAIHNNGARGVRQVNTPINSVARWLTGKDFGQPENADTLNRNAPDFPQVPEGAEDRTPEAAKAAEGATNVLDAGARTPAGRSATDAATATIQELGATPGKALTPQQIDKASTSYMTSYRDNGLPMVARELMRQGKYEQAKGLTDFVNEAASQEGMKAWSGAVFAAMSGDVESAASKMIEAYNTSGYFDDGYEVVPEDTSLVRDEGGNVTGMRLAMRNQETGEVNVQEGAVDDLINRGLWLLSPEKAAENYLARQSAYQESLRELAAERRDIGGKVVLEDQKAANDAALEIYKAHVGLDGKPSITFEEARRMVAGQGGAGEEETPMLRRPER